MMYQEFVERTGFYPDANLYKAIEDVYIRREWKDKDEFCAAYKANHYGLADEIARNANEAVRKELKKKDDEIWEVQDDLNQANAKIKRLEAQLEREQEWKPYIDKGAVSDNDYVSGKAAAHQIMEDKEAREWIEYEFGFAMSKIEILNTKPEFEVSRHGQLRKIGEINREPWYNATDWYYVQFQVCGMVYEAYNGSLIQR